MAYTREQLKQGLKDHMEQVEQVEKSSSDCSILLLNPEYRTAACLLSIRDRQDEERKVSTVGQRSSPVLT